MARAFVDLHCHTRASFDCLSKPADVVRLAAAARPDPPRHHRPRAHRRRARGARRPRPTGLTVIVGEEVKTADGDLIGLFLERGRPARPDARRDDRRGPRAGRPRRDAAPVRHVPRLPVAGRPARRDRAAGRLDRGPQRPAGRPRQRAGRRVRRRARPAGRRRLGRPLPHRDRRRVLRARRRSVHARRACSPRSPSGELVPGRATYFARLLTPVSKVVQRVRGNGRVQPAGVPARPPESRP